MKLIFLLISLLFSVKIALAQSVDTYIPNNAFKYLVDVIVVQESIWPEIPKQEYIPALIEHESCISLTHSKCWNPKSRLKTKREEGAGLPQITRAYRSDGSLRFDSLQEMRLKYPQYLKELSWSNVYDRVDLQILFLVLHVRDNYQAYNIGDVTPLSALQFADASYNGGRRDLNRERTICRMTKGCDANQWFGHVEKYCVKSKLALYGNRSACDINRHHVRDVFRRTNKYKPIFN